MKHKLVVDRVVEELQQGIIRGIYPQGSFLPPERELATLFNVSRSTIAKALTELAKQNLITRTQGRGTQVNSLEALGVSGVVGIYCGDPQSPYMTVLLQGIHEILVSREYRYELATVVNEDDPDSMEKLLNRYCGVIFADMPRPSSLVDAMVKNNIPYVVVCLEEDVDCTATYTDHAETTRQAVHLLAAMGHERIALIHGPKRRFLYHQVVEGYETGLEQCHLPFEQELLAESGMGVMNAYKTAQAFLAGNQEFTGWIAGRDWLATGACEALKAKGLIPGRDVSVIGFDDISWSGEASYLTTFREPIYEMGSVGAEMLIERIITGKRSIEKHELKAPLIMRRSVSPVLDTGTRLRRDIVLDFVS